jgi:hypothetical protein
MKSETSKDVINFVKEHVIHRFGIPQTITTDGGSVFISEEFKKFTTNMGIKLIRSFHIMPKQMDKLKHPIRALSSWSSERPMNILGVGMRFYQRHCGHTVFHAMEQQKLPLIT